MIATTQICLKVLDTGMLSRIQGCILGQIAGDALCSGPVCAKREGAKPAEEVREEEI